MPLPVTVTALTRNVGFLVKERPSMADDELPVVDEARPCENAAPPEDKGRERGAHSPMLSLLGAINADRLLTTLNALAIIVGGLWALYEWHDFRKQNEALTLEQQQKSLEQTTLQMREEELEVEQQKLQLAQGQFTVQQQGITKEQQQLAVDMAKASLAYQEHTNQTTQEKETRKQFEDSSDIIIVPLKPDTDSKSEARLYKVLFEFHLTNTSENPFTLCYTIESIFLANQESLLRRDQLAAMIPFPPAPLHDEVYNPGESVWRRAGGAANVYQERTRDCADSDFVLQTAGYDNPIRGGGGTDVIQPGTSRRNDTSFLIRGMPTDWVGTVITFGIGDRYEFRSHAEPLEAGVGERQIGRWQDAGSN
jgi:hypothetical protein